MAPKPVRFNALYLAEDDHYLEDHGAHLVACAALGATLGYSAPAAAPPQGPAARLRARALL